MNSAPDPSSELVQLVLSEFQDALRANLLHPLSATDGRPPRYGYVEHTKWVDAIGTKGEPLLAWHISADNVRSSPVRHAHSWVVNGMFYDLFVGWFSFAEDMSELFVNWQAGPRFGKGFRHRIGKDTNGRYLLGRGASTWIS